MKNRIFLIAIVLLQLSFSNLLAQDVTTVEALSKDISDNLDLEAVASIFGKSEDLEDFERRLNDPDTQICNLDLNEDGEVDYLRVLETAEKNTHLITIQAVIGKDLFQDVATIDVEKDNSGETRVQVVGDVYLYGNDYIIEPIYVHHPVFFVHFWTIGYNPWYSPYYYNYYPTYYNPWRPYPVHRYRRFVHNYVDKSYSYNYVKSRRSRTSVVLHEKIKRNDYAKRNPTKSFVERNKGIENKSQLDATRKTSKVTDAKTSREFTGKKVQKDWTPSSSNERKETNTLKREVKSKEMNKPKVESKNENYRSKTPSVDRKEQTRTKNEVKVQQKRVETKTKEVQRSKVNSNSSKPSSNRQTAPSKSVRTKKDDRN